MPGSKGKRAEKRIVERARRRATGGGFLIRLRPSLFLAVREEAHSYELSVPMYVSAVLHDIHFPDDGIFNLTPEEIRRKLRG